MDTGCVNTQNVISIYVKVKANCYTHQFDKDKDPNPTYTLLKPENLSMLFTFRNERHLRVYLSVVMETHFYLGNGRAGHRDFWHVKM